MVPIQAQCSASRRYMAEGTRRGVIVTSSCDMHHISKLFHDSLSYNFIARACCLRQDPLQVTWRLRF